MVPLVVNRPAARPGQPVCGLAGTLGYSPQLFVGNGGDTVRKPSRTSAADREAVDESGSGRRGARRTDRRLADLYQATLEEPIPDDMLRLVEMIGTHDSRS